MERAAGERGVLLSRAERDRPIRLACGVDFLRPECHSPAVPQSGRPGAAPVPPLPRLPIPDRASLARGAREWLFQSGIVDSGDEVNCFDELPPTLRWAASTFRPSEVRR